MVRTGIYVIPGLTSPPANGPVYAVQTLCGGGFELHQVRISEALSEDAPDILFLNIAQGDIVNERTGLNGTIHLYGKYEVTPEQAFPLMA